MSLESHYELGTDVALSILAVIITMADNHSTMHVHVRGLYQHVAAYEGYSLYQCVGPFNPTCNQCLECRLFFTLLLRIELTPYH